MSELVRLMLPEKYISKQVNAHRQSSRFKDLSGQEFGELTVLSRAENQKKHAAWNCLCSCGNKTVVSSTHLLTGHTKSCGHLAISHGLTGKRLYRIWRGMKTRCTVVDETHYPYYGERGITVCEAWRGSFEAFRDWALANGYRDDLTIDRIDVNGNYCPENCRWATTMQQGGNRRNNVFYEIGGEVHTVPEWSRISKVKIHTIQERIKRGWNIERAVFTAPKGGCNR